ncbi:DUF4184 family protein [Hymenobacter elongatus]|nr:DUF4184 family protein [Hymenobacter elongatus]
MPFTLAHPAIVLPLLRPLRRHLSATALILGAMAPDFEYFLRLRPDGIYGHTLAGIFWLDIPLVVLFAMLFHRLVKQPLIHCLPRPMRQRLVWPARQPWPWRRAFRAPVLLGAFVGTVSHILWDAFTHDDGGVVLHWPLLMQPVAVGALHWPIYKFLQHGSTLAGFFGIGWFLWQLPAQAGPARLPLPAQRTFWLAIGGIVLLLWGPFMLYSARIWPFDLASVIVTGMSAGLVGVLVAAGTIRRRFLAS